MYGHVSRATHFRLIIDRKTFNQIFKRCSYNKKNDVKEFLEINLIPTFKCQTAITQPNEFIRFVCNGWYMDIGIKKIITEQAVTIQLGKVIDYSKINHTKTIK